MRETTHFVNKRGKKLSGIINNGRKLALTLVFLHGFAGNKDENGLFIEAEDFFMGKGYNTVRFDFEGAGDSEGEFQQICLADQVSDLESVLDQLDKRKICVVGFSLGATIALMYAGKQIDFYAFWSPALFPQEDMFPRYDTEEIRAELEKKGYIEKAGLKVGKRIIDDLKDCDIQEQMHSLSKPVLLVHGTEDLRIDYMNTIRAQKYFLNAYLQLISGANHSFKLNADHRQALFDTTCKWLDGLLCE